MHGYLEWVIMQWEWDNTNDQVDVNGNIIQAVPIITPISFHRCNENDNQHFYEKAEKSIEGFVDQYQ